VKFFSRKIKPDWIFPKSTDKSGKKVWRLLPGGGVLVIEIRDTDKKTTEFAGIDLSSGALLWKNDQLEEKWWTTLNVIYRDTVLLQQFARPDMPTPGKIFTLDLHTGKLLWQNQEVSFMNADGDTIYCLKKSFTDESVVGINFRSGVEREVSPPELPNQSQLLQSDLTFPEPIDGLSNNFQGQIILDDRVRMKIPSDSKQVTILKIGEKIVIGFYAMSGKDEKGGTLYEARLIVADAEGKFIFEDIVDRRVYVPLEDFYFAVEGKLIYVRNSVEIVAVKLD
jgi:Domain of unknown function (DUF4905)